MGIYNYYAIDYNRFEEKQKEQNEFNTRLKLELEATRASFENAFDYFKKEIYKIEQLEMIID